MEIQKTETLTNIIPAALMAGMEADAGLGYETLDVDSKAKPFLILIQETTPMAKKSNADYVPGVEAGMFFNTVTKEYVTGEAGVRVIPCGYRRVFIERERPLDGAYIRTVDIGDQAVRDARNVEENGKKLLVTPNGTKLVDTRYHFCLAAMGDGAFEPVVITLKSSQISKSKTWNSIMERCKVRAATGAILQVAPWWQIYNVTSKPESAKDHSWFGWDIKFAGVVQDGNLATAGRAFYNLVINGGVSPDEKHEDVTPF